MAPVPLWGEDVDFFAVDPAVQRRGAGRHLALAAIGEARRRGARKLRLHVLGTNTAARALYTSCGFSSKASGARSFTCEAPTSTTS